MVKELREIMADLGFKTVNEMIGQVDCLEVRENITHWKYSKLDLSPILYKEPASESVGLYKQEEQDHGLENVLDWQLLDAAKSALEKQKKINATFNIKNTDRTIGSILSNEITKRYRSAGLPDNTIHFKFYGTAGQSFGAFNTKGITLELEGDANDYFGKGLSGARLIIYPAKEATFVPEDNIIIGNVAFYGATSGEAFIRGKAGERFAVRNSGVSAVTEGVGGRVVILGDTGRNFGAGMSGGIAYVYDVKGNFATNCNPEMVDLDPVNEEDAKELKILIEKHYQYTGSTVAKFVLDDFENQQRNFVKVFPRDYKKALTEKKKKLELSN